MHAVELLTRFSASVLAIVQGADPHNSLLAILSIAAAIGLATIVVGACARYVVSLVSSLMMSAWRFAHEPADLGELLGQSDPDAEGRARPRAPSSRFPVAL
jgi:hypothetical protein